MDLKKAQTRAQEWLDYVDAQKKRAENWSRLASKIRKAATAGDDREVRRLQRESKSISNVQVYEGAGLYDAVVRLLQATAED